MTADAFATWMRAFASAVAAEREALTQLDAAIGDADHGTNMDRGMQAALERLDGQDDVGGLAKGVGMALVSKVGGAAGPLYGTLFLQFGTAAAGKAELSPQEFADALAAGVAGVRQRGKAEPEDKTMVDALLPAVDALRAALDAGEDMPTAVARAADAAEAGMRATVPLVARKGRASYLGERSRNHQDPGATSSALLVRTAAQTLAGNGRE